MLPDLSVSPSMNFMEGTIRKNGSGVDFVLASGQKLEVPQTKAALLAGQYADKKVILGIRPEHFSEEVKEEHANLNPSRCRLTGKVVVKEMLGSESIFYLKEQRAGEYAARLTVDTKGAPGDEMTLYVDMNRVHFFDADTEKNIFLSWRSAMKQLMEKTKGRNAYFYLIPCFLVFAVFLFYPFVKTIYLSLFLTDKLGQAKVFVGLDNYVDLLTSESFYNSLLVTVIFVVIVVIGSMLIGLIGAVLCSKAFPGIRVFSTSYALPMAIASSGAAMIFKIILNPTIGILNKMTGLDINWIADPKYALICVAVLTAWLNSGINFLYFSAGLGNIDESIYERASVDGANGIQKFFRLTLPGLSPIMFYTLVVNIIQAFQSFGQIKILTAGGPESPRM